MNTTPYTQTQEDLDILRGRLLWLAGLRWYGAGGIVLALLIGIALGMQLPPVPLLIIAAFTCAYNYHYLWKARQPQFDPAIALHQILLDVGMLTLALLFSGGFLNPFFTFYFFIVILASMILPARQSLLIVALVTLCFALQGLSRKLVTVDMKLSSDGFLRLGELPFHLVGAPISFVLTNVITAYFLSVIMRDLRKRNQEVRQARQQTELELRKLDNLLDRLQAGMLVLDSAHYIERVNDRLVAWFGREGCEENQACYWISRFGKQYRPGEDNGKMGEPQFYEVRLPTLRQGVRDFEIMVNPVSDGSGLITQTIMMVLDVTEQKKTQSQWAQTQKLAAIGQLAAGVAHEINTPLGTISILADEAREILKEVPQVDQCPHSEDLKDALDTIHGQVLRCKNITQSLLNFSRKSERSIETCSINEMVRQAVELIRHKAPGVAIEENLEPNLPEITTDVHGVERAVFNLLLNAADAVEKNPRDKRITVATARRNGRWTIEVGDNGHGIEEADLPHIFEPFFTTKDVGKGTGLGLYMSYGTIRDLGGDLEITSRAGQGTKATIWLPDEQ